MRKGRKKYPRSWSSKILPGINLLLATAILLSYLAPVVNPKTTSIPALLGLVYPVLFISNLLFLTWWILRARWFFIISLLAILIGWNVFFKHFGFGRDNITQTSHNSLKILSYNVRMFDVQNWRQGQDAVNRDSIMSFLNRENADIVCFQEFFHGDHNYFSTVEPFADILKAGYIHTDFVISRGGNKHFGLATFSRFPIINKEIIHFQDAMANSGIYSDVVVDGDTIRIFNVHLESVKFSNSDYKYVSEFMEPGAGQISSNSKIIFSKLKKAFVKRAEQAKVVAGYINQSSYPIILCGDFNDTPSSFAYHTISHGLQDAFLNSGFGLGATYAGDVPFLRIDFILHSPELLSSKYEQHKVNFSDHYPISCYFWGND